MLKKHVRQIQLSKRENQAFLAAPDESGTAALVIST